MERTVSRKSRRTWRRALFWTWIAGSSLVALYIALAAPLVPWTGISVATVGAVVPPFMIFMLATGLAWLAYFVHTRPRRQAHR